jgi:GAF domain-containing protein
MENTFGVPIIPENEEARLENLHNYNILDTRSEGPFNNVASIAAHMFKTPMAFVSFVDESRVWFKANVGLEGVTNTPRGVSLCSLAVLSDQPTVFQNTLEESCLMANPLVAGEFGMRFYAAAPIKTPEGFNIGAVCVVDKEPRNFSVADQRVLEHLAAIVMDELKLRALENNNPY